MNLDPTTLDPVCHIAYGRNWPAASDARTQPIESDLRRSGYATQLSETLAEPPRHQGWPWPRGNKKIWHRPADVIVTLYLARSEIRPVRARDVRVLVVVVFVQVLGADDFRPFQAVAQIDHGRGPRCREYA